MRRPTLVLSLPFLVSLFIDNATTIPLAQTVQNSKRDVASDAAIAKQANTITPDSMQMPGGMPEVLADPAVAKLASLPESYNDATFFDNCCVQKCLFCQSEKLAECGCPEECGALVASTLCFGVGPQIIPTATAENLPILQTRGLPLHQRIYKRLLGDWDWYKTFPNSEISAPAISRPRIRTNTDPGDLGRRVLKHAFRKELLSTSTETGSDVEALDGCFCTFEELRQGTCLCGDELLSPGKGIGSTTYDTTYILPAYTGTATGAQSTSILISTTTQAPKATETAVIPCGCTNDCKINGGEICPQFCDPKYECPGDEAADAPVLRKRSDDYESDGHPPFLDDLNLNEFYGDNHDGYGSGSEGAPSFSDSEDGYNHPSSGSYGTSSSDTYGSSPSYDPIPEDTHGHSDKKFNIKNIHKAPKAKAQGIVSDIIHQRLKDEKKGHLSPNEQVAQRLHGYKGSHSPTHPSDKSQQQQYDQKFTIKVKHDDQKVKTTIERPDHIGTFAETTVKFDDGPKAGGFVIDNKKIYSNGQLVEETRVEQPTMQFLSEVAYNNSAGSKISPLGIVHPANPTQAAAILGEAPTHNIVLEIPDQGLSNNHGSSMESGYDSDGDGYQSELSLLAHAFPEDFEKKPKMKLREKVVQKRPPVIAKQSPVLIEEDSIIMEEPIYDETTTIVEEKKVCPYAGEHDCSTHETTDEDHHEVEKIEIGEPIITDKHIDHVEVGKPIIINTNKAHPSITHGDEKCPHKAKSEPCPYEAAGLICPHVSRHVDVAAHHVEKIELGEPTTHTTKVDIGEPIVIGTTEIDVKEPEHKRDDHEECPYKKHHNLCPDEVAGHPCSHVTLSISKPKATHDHHHPAFSNSDSDNEDWGNVPADRIDRDFDNEEKEFEHNHDVEVEVIQGDIEVGDEQIDKVLTEKKEELKEAVVETFHNDEEKHESKEEHNGDEHDHEHGQEAHDYASKGHGEKRDGPEPLVVFAPW